MVREELYAHLIACNLVRDLIVQTAYRFDASPKDLSHKGAVQALNAFAQNLQGNSARIEELEEPLLESTADHPIGDRKPRNPLDRTNAVGVTLQEAIDADIDAAPTLRRQLHCCDLSVLCNIELVA